MNATNKKCLSFLRDEFSHFSHKNHARESNKTWYELITHSFRALKRNRY